MKIWLRRVVPDLFIASVVALAAAGMLHFLDSVETDRIVSEVRWKAHDGLTLDERLGVFESSLRRSLYLHIPLLVAVASLLTSLLCRNRGWAWLTSILAVIPALLMGMSYVIDLPVIRTFVVAAYVGLSIGVATLTTLIRNRFVSPAEASAPEAT